MKKTFTLILLLLAGISVQAQFDKFFYNKTLRMDYIHAGESTHEEIYFEELLEEPFWGGSKVNLVDTAFYGNYYLNVYDAESDQQIYSRGYSTLFGEWMATAEADSVNFSACETVVMPYPKKDVCVEICHREKGKLVPVFSRKLDVDSYFIKKERRMVYPTYDVLYSGDPAKCVDIVLLPEGYTADEMGQFKEDCKAFVDGVFAYSPYKENKERFNVRAVMAPSEESGTDIPAENCWRKTILNTSFYTFNSERYLMSFDNKSIRDLASNVPYDFVYILVNSQKYGGGAIYNHYGISVSGNELKEKIYAHEFCHVFLGLADEYVGTTAYNDMYDASVEPWEANLTTLVDFSTKWADMLDKDVPVPTPATKKYMNTLGVFEGGGYAATGVYRPAVDCMMNTFNGDVFCPVCKRAILRQIDFYAK